jgi:hypothetical protein
MDNLSHDRRHRRVVFEFEKQEGVGEYHRN